MASVLYNSFKELLLTAGIDCEADDLRVILIDTADYTYSSAHNFLDDVAAGSRVAVSAALSSKTITGGALDAADITFSSVTGDPCEALIVYKHTGTDSTSNLVAYYDGLSITPNGGNITVQWGASGLFYL